MPSRHDRRGPPSRRRKGRETITRSCLKCDEEFETEPGYHICQPCTWQNQRSQRIYGLESMLAPSWWH